MKSPRLRFWRQRKRTNTSISFHSIILFWNRTSTNLFLGYFVYIVGRERDGIIATDIRQCKVIFWGDVFVDVTVVDLKVPIQFNVKSHRYLLPLSYPNSSTSDLDVIKSVHRNKRMKRPIPVFTFIGIIYNVEKMVNRRQFRKYKKQ